MVVPIPSLPFTLSQKSPHDCVSPPEALPNVSCPGINPERSPPVSDDHVANPLASEVRIFPIHCVPFARRKLPDTERVALGVVVPIPTFPHDVIRNTVSALELRTFRILKSPPPAPSKSMSVFL